MNTLEVLNGSGHLTLSWDAADTAQVADARAEVERLKAAGYSFFLVDGAPADAVAAGDGQLRCVRVAEPPNLPAAVLDPPAAPAPGPARRGRPVGSTRTVAVRPQAGG